MPQLEQALSMCGLILQYVGYRAHTTGVRVTIAEVDFSHLGYRLLKPGGAFEPKLVDGLANVARTRADYEVERTGDARWIRHRDRKNGMVVPLLREIAAVSAVAKDFDAALEALRASDPAWGDVDQRYIASIETCINLCAPSRTEPPYRQMHFLTAAATLVPREDLVSMLAWHVLPAYFRLFPTGHFVAFEISYQLEVRLGMCRNLHRFSQHPLSTFAKDDPPALHQLHAQSSYEAPRILVDLLSAMTYPWVTTTSAARSGLLFVFVLDPPPEHTEPLFPASWSATLRGTSDFARAQLDLQRILGDKDPAYRKAASLRRHLLREAPSAPQTLALLRYSIERFSRTLWHATDPAEHCLPHSHVIAPLAPFEFGLTLDRVLRKGVLAVMGSSEVDRKDDCFEIADLLEELWSQRNGAHAGSNFFKKLFDRSSALALLDACVAGAPASAWPAIVPAVRDAYDRLVSGVSSSVVISSKITSRGILVRNKALDSEVMEPIESFVANVVRALRNAHHGYLTSNDPGKRPARYLSLVSGHLPEEVSLLSAFWVWAAVTNPEVMFSRPWMQLGGFEA